METTETPLHDLPNIEPDIILTPSAQDYLRQAGKWASLLGIIGFIMTGFLVLASVFATALMSAMSAATPMPFNIGPFIGVLYFLIALLYFFFSLYLYQFGKRIKAGIGFVDSHQIAMGLSKLKSFFKLAGITTIVVICLYVVIIIGAVLVGVAASKM